MVWCGSCQQSSDRDWDMEPTSHKYSSVWWNHLDTPGLAEPSNTGRPVSPCASQQCQQRWHWCVTSQEDAIANIGMQWRHTTCHRQCVKHNAPWWPLVVELESTLLDNRHYISLRQCRFMLPCEKSTTPGSSWSETENPDTNSRVEAKRGNSYCVELWQHSMPCACCLCYMDL